MRKKNEKQVDAIARLFDQHEEFRMAIAPGKRNLSFARARYIYEYLMKNGVAKKRMKYIGLKHKYPLGGDPKFDRRVEIEITNIKE